MYARWLMGLTLAFHITFAAIGVALPLMMTIAEWRWLRSGKAVYRELAQKWSKGVAILFAVGAVTGTVISFELGLLWPRFMDFAGPLIGFPFSLEGFAFFIEAIFLGIYLYGWERVSRQLHFFSGIIIALSSALSGFLVTLTNAWMNNPVGFALIDGKPHNISPIVAMFPPGFAEEVIHVLLSCYAAVGFAVAGIHAFYLWRQPSSTFHRTALLIAIGVGGIAALLQPISGDFSARHVATNQPRKLAAIEGHYLTTNAAPLHIGGIPDDDTMTTPYALKIPYGLSLLAFHDPHAKVLGLEEFPRHTWPNTLLVHLAFQIMVGLGFLMAFVVLLIYAAMLRTRWRKQEFVFNHTLLAIIMLCTPIGYIALETGWLVTEWGRQPYTIMNTMLTSAAVTPMPNLATPFWVIISLFALLGVSVTILLSRMIHKGSQPTMATMTSSAITSEQSNVHC